MEFSIDRNTLLSAVQMTLGIAGTRKSLPILNNILIQARKEDVFTVKATNTEISLSSNYEAHVIIEGKTLLPAKVLYEITRQCQADEIHFLKDNPNMVITAGTTTYKIPSVPVDDFPDIEEEVPAETFRIEKEALSDLFSKVSPAMSTDGFREELNGVYIELERHALQSDKTYIMRLVATDGFRLATAVSPPFLSDCMLEVNRGIIIPKEGVNEIRRFVDKAATAIEMCILDGKCVLGWGKSRLTISLVNREFPDYRRVLPLNIEDYILFNKNHLLSALKRMLIIADKYCEVFIKISRDTMILTSRNLDVGEATEEIKVQNKSEKEYPEVAYNVGYLIDGVTGLREDLGKFSISPKNHMMTIKSSDENYTYVVMPLQHA